MIFGNTHIYHINWLAGFLPSTVSLRNHVTFVFLKVCLTANMNHASHKKTHKSHTSSILLHPLKQTWNLKMDPWKRRFLLETIISRFQPLIFAITICCVCAFEVESCRYGTVATLFPRKSSQRFRPQGKKIHRKKKRGAV